MAKAAICRSCVDKASSLSQPCNNLCLAASLLDSILECVGRGVMARSVCLMWIIIYDYIHEKRLESKAPVKQTNGTGLMKLRPTCSLQVGVSAFKKNTNHNDNGGPFLFWAFVGRPSINPCLAFSNAPAGCSQGPPKNHQQGCLRASQKGPS